MATSIKDVMAHELVSLTPASTAAEAARAMRDRDVGDVIVMDGSRLVGLVTDRDITVRAVAEGRNPAECRLSEICSGEIATVSPDDPIEAAVGIMRERAVRRVPVVDGGRPVGIVSIGDLAIERDERSALADVSAAAPNR